LVVSNFQSIFPEALFAKFYLDFWKKGEQMQMQMILEFRKSAMGGVSRFRYAFFIAPIPKFIEDFNETINHWFWRNPHQGPYSFESG